MNNRRDAYNRYVAEFATFEESADKVEQLLTEACSTVGLKPDIKVRAKTVASFIKKMHSKPYTKPWEQTTDKVGGRIITETVVDLEKAREIFKRTDDGKPFEVLRIEDKSDDAEAEDLYYPGIHIQAVVPGVTTSDGERIECEIQLRTKAQDAWAVAAHGRLYKGLIPLSKTTARRLLRLSVLSEMFDQEVKIAMDEIQSEPGYESAVLLHAAEALFLPLSGQPGDNGLSFEVFDLLQGVLILHDRATYLAELAAFVATNSHKIQGILDTYGPNSDFAGEWTYWLFSQPESIVIFQMIDQNSIALSREIRGTDIEGAVHRLFEVWGNGMPNLGS